MRNSRLQSLGIWPKTSRMAHSYGWCVVLTVSWRGAVNPSALGLLRVAFVCVAWASCGLAAGFTFTGGTSPAWGPKLRVSEVPASEVIPQHGCCILLGKASLRGGLASGETDPSASREEWQEQPSSCRRNCPLYCRHSQVLHLLCLI